MPLVIQMRIAPLLPPAAVKSFPCPPSPSHHNPHRVGDILQRKRLWTGCYLTWPSLLVQVAVFVSRKTNSRELQYQSLKLAPGKSKFDAVLVGLIASGAFMYDAGAERARLARSPNTAAGLCTGSASCASSDSADLEELEPVTCGARRRRAREPWNTSTCI